MSVDRNYKQIWGFRGGDDEIDSSSDDSKSDEANHKLASVVLPVNGEISDDPDNQNTDKVEPDAVQPRKPRIKKGMTTKAKGKKKKTQDALKKEVVKKATGMKRKTENVLKKEVGKKRRKSSALNSAIIDELKTFAESIIQEFKLEREQMFALMKEDMQKLLSVKSSARETTKTMGRQKTVQTGTKKSIETEMRPQNCSGETLERSIVSSRMPDQNNCSNALPERVKCDQVVQTINSNKKGKGERVRLLTEQSTYSYNPSDHFASSYLTLPSAPSETQLEQQNTESPYRNCLKPGVAGNGSGTGLTFDGGSATINAMNHCGYISGSQVEVPFPSYAQMGSKNVSFTDQHCNQNSNMGNVFPLPLHQRYENSFNIPSQVGKLPQGNNILGWRMNGGNIIFSGNGNALPDNIAGNMVLNRFHYRANGKVAEYGIQDITDGKLN